MLFILLILEIALTLFSYILTGKNFSSPSVLSNLSFLFSTVLLCAYVPKWELKISFATCMVIFSGNIMLLVGEILSQSILEKRAGSKMTCPYKTNPENVDFEISVPRSLTICFLIFELVSIALVYFYISRNTIITYDYAGQARTLLMSYRGQQDELHATWVTALLTVGKILMYFYTFVVLYTLIYARKKLSGIEIATLVAAVCLCTLSSSRIDIILLAGSVVVWIYGLIKRKYQNLNLATNKMIKYLFLVLLLMLSLFFAMGTLTGKTGSTLSSILDTIVVYAGGGTIGLDEYIKTFRGSEFFKSSETLYGLSSILTKIGMQPLCKYRNLEFFFMGNSRASTGNTYTVYRRLLHDYGYVATFLIRIAEGFIFGYLTNKIYQTKKSRKYFERLFLYGTLTGVLVTESVDTLFLMTLPTISEIIMLIILCSLYRLVTRIDIRFESSAKIIIRKKLTL